MALVQQVIAQATPVVLSLTGIFFAWLANEIRGKVRNERVAQWLENANDLAASVVNELEQTTVAAMKADAEDGKLDAGDARDIRNQALGKLKTHLGPKGISEALKIFGFADEAQLTKLLITKIESTIASSKLLKAPPAAILDTTEPTTLKPPAPAV